MYGNQYAAIFWKNQNLADYIIEEKGFGVHISQEQLRVDILKLSKQKHSMSKATSVNNSIRGASKNIVAVRQPYGSSSTIQVLIQIIVKKIFHFEISSFLLYLHLGNYWYT